MKAKDQLLCSGQGSPVLQTCTRGIAARAAGPVVVDREKASTFGVTFEDINNTISANLGSAYINDFPNRGRMQRVIVQSDDQRRMQADDSQVQRPQRRGQLVPLASFATVRGRWADPDRRLQCYPSVRISGAARADQAAATPSRRWRSSPHLPRGFGFEWSGQSLQEKLSGSQAPFLLACLRWWCSSASRRSTKAGPFRSPSSSRAAGHARRRAGGTSRGLPNDVYFKVALITIVGLAAKNGILIIEFAKDLRTQGKPLADATIEACYLRFRPILMTGLAFICGVAPMVVAAGASAKSQQAIGTSVMGGMIAVVVLALAFVPVFFVVVLKSAEWLRSPKARRPAVSADDGKAAIVPERQA